MSQFIWDFALDAKSIEEADDGTLYIEGYASDFEPDRVDDLVDPESLQKALEAYMVNPVLCYHHKVSELMGRVVTAAIDSKGLKVKAEVPRPEPGTERFNRYMDVKRGHLRGFSIAGVFERARLAGGKARCYVRDLVEISLTPTPINPRTLGSLAGKALEDFEEIRLNTEALDRLEEALAALSD